ncbi:UNVERIFIED_CONTAM: hypothetical protein HDU68_009912 [Siphonaria sp. JEL0065]|nr:hypothetical protein HDU68_009912 [Siphonaria sp. JEL0065]
MLRRLTTKVASVGTGEVRGLPFVDVSSHFKPVTAIAHAKGRVLVLNEPKMDLDGMSLVRRHLEEWDGDKDVKVITMIKRSSVPIFCGGLKVNYGSEWEEAIEQSSLLAHQIATLNTPLVSIMDGPTHGLGASLSIHAPFRISTDSTILSFKEGPGGIGMVLPGTAFALRRLLLDDSVTTLKGRKESPLAKYLAVVGEDLKGIENVLAGVSTHHVPTERISPLVTRLCETKSSDLRILDLAIEEFTASSPSFDDWGHWSVGQEPLDLIYKCFKYDSLAEIVGALKKENTQWSEKILSLIHRNCPTVMDLNIEAVNLAIEPQDLLTSFKNDLSMLRGVEESVDFQAALKAEANLVETTKVSLVEPVVHSKAEALRPEVVLDPKLLNRDTWLASELDGATASKDDVESKPQFETLQKQQTTEPPIPQWSTTIEKHISLTSTPKLRATWLKKGKWLENKEEDVDFGRQAIDGNTSIWINRTFSVYPHRTVTGLPHAEDVEKVVKGEAVGSGDVAMTPDEVKSYFSSNWNNFLDELRNLTPIGASPVENWRVEDDPGAGKLSAEVAKTFFPAKYYDFVETVNDPNLTGIDDRERYNQKRKEKWGLRQRIEYLLEAKCKVVEGLYVQWK